MTNTTDKFIDLLNESVFKAFGWETRIEKVPTETADATQGVPLESQTLTDESTLNDAEKLAARKARIEAARKATESADIPATNN